MTFEQKMKNLSVPQGRIDVVLDTDAYNEIDDQFAIAYMIKSDEKLDVQAIYAAPFHNGNSSGPKDGMEKSYNEIFKILKLIGKEYPVFEGSTGWLQNDKTPIVSPAAEDLVARAKNYSPDKPLYVVAIGAITNVASALLIDPSIKDNIVVVWLGGHSLEFHDTREFNMAQDFSAARAVMGSGVPFVQLPCAGVVSQFTVSRPDLETYFKGRNALGDYLADNTIRAAESYAAGTPWTRVIWDVTAVAWLLNDDNRFMMSRVIPTHMPNYDGQYNLCPNGDFMRYVFYIERDQLMTDLVKKITK
ncbi:MAG: nucleoside hydrolase [Clostridia bacterium]|nr:nucleoside hydrolase [Clostridia bacterium]